MTEDLTTDFQTTPYWWEAAPPDTTDAIDPPAKADAVVVGSGYTGLHAALQIARAGRSVVVLDKGVPGQGCSTRNGGQISRSVKHGLKELTRRFGETIAHRVMADGLASRRFIEDFVRSEQLDCSFETCGRFHAAHNARALSELRTEIANQSPGYEMPVTLVEPDRQREEIGSDYYHGGAVYHEHASVDPARYHAGLLRLVRAAGATICAQTTARHLATDKDGVSVETDRGSIRARDVVLATNGYSGDLSPWHRDRIIPIGSYMIATEELPDALMQSFFPKNRIVSDSRKVVYYYRASPDRKRILFGGRVSAGETAPEKSAARLLAELRRIFPDLSDYKASHAWMGFVGYTFDTLAHAGQRDHVHFAAGYCGSGVGMASYLGMKTGLSVLGNTDAECGLSQIDFPTRPLYRGNPWFLPAAVEYYRMRDRIGL